MNISRVQLALRLALEARDALAAEVEALRVLADGLQTQLDCAEHNAEVFRDLAEETAEAASLRLGMTRDGQVGVVLESPAPGAPEAQPPLDESANTTGVATGSRNDSPCERVTLGSPSPAPLKLQRCDMCGTVAMPDPTLGCRTCGWDEMTPILPGETLIAGHQFARVVRERDEARATLARIGGAP